MLFILFRFILLLFFIILFCFFICFINLLLTILLTGSYKIKYYYGTSILIEYGLFRLILGFLFLDFHLLLLN